MPVIGGRAHIKVNGTTYTTSVEDGFEIKIQKEKHDPVMGSDGVVHSTLNPVPDTISGTLILVPGLNPETLIEADNATVQVVLASGRTAMLRNAFFTGDPAVTTKDGKFKVEFTGNGEWL